MNAVTSFKRRISPFVFFVFSLLILSPTNLLAEESTLKALDIQVYTHPQQEMTVIGAQLNLPEGTWEITNRDELTGLRHIQWISPLDESPMTGARYLKIEDEKVKNYIRQFYHQIEMVALLHADYTLTMNDFKTEEDVIQLAQAVGAESGEDVPSFSYAVKALQWLNTGIAPYKIYSQHMEQKYLQYQGIQHIAKINKEYGVKKFEELTDAQLKKVALSSLGKQLKRSILHTRYKQTQLTQRPKTLQGPSTIENFEDHMRKIFYQRSYAYNASQTDKEEQLEFFMLPDVQLTRIKEAPKSALVIELHPLLDDGKHWVLMSDGLSERVAIDQSLARTHGLTIQPFVQEEKEALPAYQFRALVLPQAQGPWELKLKEAFSADTRRVRISKEMATTSSEQVFDQWSKARALEWARMYQLAPSTIYMSWLGSYALRNKGKSLDVSFRGGRQGRRGRTTSVFNMLGGQAAIEETLQMIDLNVADAKKKSALATVYLDEIEGVQVQGHPYEEMLAGQKGGELSLAHYVPHDRFFMYFKEPGELAAYLREGVEFVHQFGSDMMGREFDYDLKARYYKRLGLNAEWVDQFLQSSFVQGAAVILPDLFFLEGTDLTVVLDVPNVGLLRPLLGLIGVKDLANGRITQKTTASGRETFWAIAQDVLMVSTNRQEMARVLELVDKKGEGSLGQSAEFRYMLTQLPLKEETKMYVYFSDPFIRRMVGPEVKISQYRRLQAKAQMELITAGALLYKSDGHPGEPTLTRLIEMGYVPEYYSDAAFILEDGFIVRSNEYGTSTDLPTILEMALTEVNANEAKAYKQYVDNYSRFWRQFFDPIAIGYDKIGSDDFRLNVFILPLIDSSIYDQTRTVLNSFDAGKKLAHLKLTPDPVMSISANVNEDTWVEIVKGFSSLKKFMNLNPGIFDEFGPSMHIAVLDGDPIINIGSGDFLGLMGRAGGAQMFRARQSLWWPMAFMMFTRPTKIIFELKDAAKVIQHLHNVHSNKSLEGTQRWARSVVDFTQVGTKDEWSCRIALFGMLNLRYGIKVQDGFLIFSNVPWSQAHEVALSEQDYLNSMAVTLHPDAAQLQLPGLYNTAVERLGMANRRNMAYLTPLVELHDGDIEKAQEQYQYLFGFKPLHSGKGCWHWENGRLESSTFGNLFRQRQPEYEPGDRDFGLFRKFNDLSVSMQFEDEGLRTKIRWSPH